jgi:predicted TIM-barrel fold metal-dependent hydrolase
MGENTHADLGFAAFDADNHYYEGLDAFTRHVPKVMQARCVQWSEIEGRKYHVVGGRVSRAVTNATFTPIAKAGAMYEYFRGNPNGRNPLEMLQDREPIPDAYRHPLARVKELDRQGLEACWLFPTLGVLYEEPLKHDIEALTTTFTAFNRWLDEDWGCNYNDRIFAAPYITLADPMWACAELEWALGRDARVVVMRPAAPTTIHGPRRVTDAMFDPFWARVNEAGITVVIHAGDSGYSSNGYAVDGFASSFSSGYGPNVRAFHIERAAYDFLITLAFDKLFERFPNLRIASVENGSEFLPDLVRKLKSYEGRMPGYFKQNPIELFREHVWINPFWEDDPNEIASIVGSDRVLFGSDWPHIEGMPDPLDYVPELNKFSDADRQLIMRDNVRELTARRPG